MAKARSEEFKSPICRLSYASGLFKARGVKQADGSTSQEKFSATLIFKKADRPALEKILAQVITAEWGPAGIEKAKKGLIRSPFLAGDGKEARSKSSGDLQPGMGPDVFFLRVQAGKDRAPWVRWKDVNAQETEANVYSGCYGKAVLNAFAWHNSLQGDGVSFGISGFQKLQEGERLGGGFSDPSEHFETIEDAGEAPDSTKSGDGAAGLFGG